MVRRSDPFWAGLWPDLVIGQELMHSLKNRGGLIEKRALHQIYPLPKGSPP